jgi:parallel beta-helix repeat protein
MAGPAAAAPFTVTNVNASGAGSLFQAITDANVAAGADTISFSIGSLHAAQTINQTAALPVITGPVTIDGRTQNTPNNATPITLTGTSAPAGTSGLVFNGGPGHSQVTGLVIAGFPAHGIDIPGGASTVVAGDFILNSGLDGVHVTGQSSGTVVTGSDIGSTETAAVGNHGVGVALDQVTGVTVGAVANQPFLGSHLGNVISGNTGDGIQVLNTAGDNTIAGNLIGTDGSGQNAIPNGGAGIHVAAAHGPTRIQAANLSGTPIPNLIAGNTGDGVLVDGAGVDTRIDSNHIADDQSPANGGDGIDLRGPQSQVTNNILDHNAGVGLRIDGVGASSNAVFGNLIGLSDADSGAGNTLDGVRIETDAAHNTIGGGNTVSNNGRLGIFAQGAGTLNLIQGNTVGTDTSGTVGRGNGNDGIKADASDNTSILGNLSSGNHGAGIDTENASGLVVSGNTVGTNRAATGPVPNDVGVRVFSQGTTIGGSGAGGGNVIAGNSGAGVDVEGKGTQVQGNAIGLGAGGRAVANGGDGVLSNVVGTVVGGAGGAANTIASNAGAGVRVGAGETTTVAENGIFDNGALGIDVDPPGVTAAGAPVLTSAVASGAATTIAGTLTSTANTTFTVRFSASPSCDPSGFGEGKTPLGATAVRTDAAGRASFTANVAPSAAGGVATATATDSGGATSEFSACRSIAAPPSVANTGNATATTTTATNATAPLVAPPPPPVPPVCTLALSGTTAGVTASVVCDRAASVSLSGSAAITTKRKRRKARRAAVKQVAFGASTLSVAPGATAKVKLALPRAAIAAVKRHGKVSLAVQAVARTADGASATRTASIAKLRAAKRKHKRRR